MACQNHMEQLGITILSGWLEVFIARQTEATPELGVAPSHLEWKFTLTWELREDIIGHHSSNVGLYGKCYSTCLYQQRTVT